MTTERSHIHIISTGGTIEKSYCESDGSMQNRTSVIKSRIFSRLRLPYVDLSFHPLIAKDSLFLEDKDRDLILAQIKILLALNHPIIILHGTDTMAQSAKYCFDRIDDLGSPIVFTGAMLPLGFLDSDALQNVTEALIVAQNFDPGLYISFHSKVHKVPHVRKNKTTRTFETVSE